MLIAITRICDSYQYYINCLVVSVLCVICWCLYYFMICLIKWLQHSGITLD